MNTIVRKKGGYSFEKGLARAKKRLAYHEEGLFLDVASRVIDAMENRGITRSNLARRMGVNPAYITKILHGHANLSLESLAKVAYAMGLRWECILLSADAQIGLFSLINGFGDAAIRTVQTATVEGLGDKPGSDENEEYGKEKQMEETSRELSVSA